MNKIVFNAGTNVVELTVENLFSFVRDGKNILKLEIKEENHSYEDVAQLKKVSGEIKHYQDDELKNNYIGYTLGANGFSCNYSNGVFSAEIVRKDEVDIKIDALWETVAEILDMIME